MATLNYLAGHDPAMGDIARQFAVPQRSWLANLGLVYLWGARHSLERLAYTLGLAGGCVAENER